MSSPVKKEAPASSISAVENQKRRIEELALAVLSELDHFRGFRPSAVTGPVYLGQQQLGAEPFIAYLDATHNGSPVRIFICRNETPLDFSASRDDVLYVSYKSQAGVLASSPLGAEKLIVVRSRNAVRPIENRYIAHSRDEFRPVRDGAYWDAVDNRIAWRDGITAFVPSLRRRSDVRPATRRVAVKVELPDQAILDTHQDAVFRKPINRTTVIDGAPGTGKTSVLIKRLAQKTRWDFLEDSERALFAKDEWDAATQRGTNWYLFTPSELLRHYLKEALSRESLPATNETVRAWDSFKRTLLRDSRILKIGSTGVFQVSTASLLKRSTSTEAAALATAFKKSLPDFVDDLYRTEIRKFSEASRLVSSDLRQQQTLVFEKALAASSAEGMSQNDAQKIADLARRLGESLRSIDLIADRAREVRTDSSKLTSSAVSSIRQQVLRTIGELQKATEQAGLFPRIEPLGAQLTKHLQTLGESLTFVRLFERLPHFFQEFREANSILGRFFEKDAVKAVKERRLDPQELDVLLFVCLEVAVEAAETGLALTNEHGANALLAARRAVVSVDEATDFSALEIACMRLLSKSGAITLCGDLMQRLTATGLSKWEDLEAFVPGAERVTLGISYRQTERLLAVCRDLFKQFVGEDPPFRSAYEHKETDPAPLHFKSSANQSAEKWIADRIVEICEISGGHLPAIGVLVPQVSDVRSTAASLRALLADHNIEVEASEDGNALGDAERVRVFAVEHIKGLEFESAFFLHIDKVAESSPDLVARYLYVGLSRARSFLGLTYSSQFPRRLQAVRSHFSDSGSFQL